MDQFIYEKFLQMPTIGLLVAIGASLYLLGKGADLLVDQAIILSKRWGIPKVVIGATIVSLGTTIPEVTVSVAAALKGSADLALGNAIGSIITNTALILGMCSMIGIVPINRKIVGKQGFFQLGSAALLTIVSLPLFNNGQALVSKKMGFIFLILLIIYVYASIVSGKKADKDQEEKDEVLEASLISQVIYMLVGLFLVIASSKILIPSVEIAAIRIGIPQSVVAATLVAFGTSLPELITSVTAVKKGHGELAVGNVVGANVLNILFVIGSSAAISSEGLIVPDLFLKVQIPVMIVTLVIFHLSSISKDNKINKVEGSLLLIIYAIYLVLNYIG